MYSRPFRAGWKAAGSSNQTATPRTPAPVSPDAPTVGSRPSRTRLRPWIPFGSISGAGTEGLLTRLAPPCCRPTGSEREAAQRVRTGILHRGFVPVKVIHLRLALLPPSVLGFELGTHRGAEV